MIYAILAYHDERVIQSMTGVDDDALMDALIRTHEKIDRDGRLGPAARLDFTKAAVTLRAGEVIDGPFAETKEQLLGLYLVEAESMEKAIQAARDLQKVNVSAVYEIRPVTVFIPGQPLPAV